MGKHGKKVARQRTRILRHEDEDEDEDEDEEEAEGCSPLPPHGVYHHHTRNKSPLHGDGQEDREENEDSDGSSPEKMPSKFSLYQQSVQSPKGDISYLRKFFLMYVGGRNPLHLQEDFCGTGLLSWSLPEIKDCLEESGFHSVHFWIREMPDTNQSRNTKEYNGDDDVKYEEVSSFSQLDAWNAYVVGVVKAKC